MSSDYYGGIAGEIADAGDSGDYDEDEDEYCEHDCGEEGCFDDGAFMCHHEHCPSCGGCGCPGYCDDYQTYNLRPAETGGAE
jgi:hypothetical protein